MRPSATSAWDLKILVCETTYTSVLCVTHSPNIFCLRDTSSHTESTVTSSIDFRRLKTPWTKRKMLCLRPWKGVSIEPSWQIATIPACVDVGRNNAVLESHQGCCGNQHAFFTRVSLVFWHVTSSAALRCGWRMLVSKFGFRALMLSWQIAVAHSCWCLDATRKTASSSWAAQAGSARRCGKQMKMCGQGKTGNARRLGDEVWTSAIEHFSREHRAWTVQIFTAEDLKKSSDGHACSVSLNLSRGTRLWASSGLMQEGKAKDIADLLSLSETQAKNGEETFKN